MRITLAVLTALALTLPAHAADQAKPPPLGPEGEQPFTGEPPAGAKGCVDILRYANAQLNQKMVRFLISRSADWGPIFRADVVDGDGVPTRFVCVTQSTPGKQPPVIFAVEPSLDPLRDGPWGKPRAVVGEDAQNDVK